MELRGRVDDRIAERRRPRSAGGTCTVVQLCSAMRSVAAPAPEPLIEGPRSPYSPAKTASTTEPVQVMYCDIADKIIKCGYEEEYHPKHQRQQPPTFAGAM